MGVVEHRVVHGLDVSTQTAFIIHVNAGMIDHFHLQTYVCSL